MHVCTHMQTHKHTTHMHTCRCTHAHTVHVFQSTLTIVWIAIYHKNITGITNELPPPPPPVLTPPTGAENSVNYTASHLTPETVIP